MTSIKQMKAVLRKQLKQRLSELTEQEKAVQSAIIKQKVLSSEVYKNSQRISIFLPMKDEVNTLPILKAMLDAGKRCFIPHYESHDMIMVNLDSWEAYEKLPRNKWGIKQPTEFKKADDALVSGGLDLIFMPGLGFTEHGARLGRGKGYYDGYLQRCQQAGGKIRTVALVFKEQIVDEIPTLDHDMNVDSVMYPTQQEVEHLVQ